MTKNCFQSHRSDSEYRFCLGGLGTSDWRRDSQYSAGIDLARVIAGVGDVQARAHYNASRKTSGWAGHELVAG